MQNVINKSYKEERMECEVREVVSKKEEASQEYKNALTLAATCTEVELRLALSMLMAYKRKVKRSQK